MRTGALRFGPDLFVVFFTVFLADFADFFAVAFTALFFLRAGAAFFFAAVRFFAFAFFAMIVLPIEAANLEPVAPHRGTGIAPRAERAPLLTSLPWTGASPPPADVPEARADMVPR